MDSKQPVAVQNGGKTFPKVKRLTEADRKRILVYTWQILFYFCLSLDCEVFQITGGAGFVGSHLVDQLMRDGHEVGLQSCDDHVTGYV